MQNLSFSFHTPHILPSYFFISVLLLLEIWNFHLTWHVFERLSYTIHNTEHLRSKMHFDDKTYWHTTSAFNAFISVSSADAESINWDHSIWEFPSQYMGASRYILESWFQLEIKPGEHGNWKRDLYRKNTLWTDAGHRYSTHGVFYFYAWSRWYFTLEKFFDFYWRPI